MKKTILFMVLAVLQGCITSETKTEMSNITEQTVETTLARLGEEYPEGLLPTAENGIRQAAGLWRASDGGAHDFIDFCVENYCASEPAREVLYGKLSCADRKSVV
mgnify:CR=1 FL=1